LVTIKSYEDRVKGSGVVVDAKKPSQPEHSQKKGAGDSAGARLTVFPMSYPAPEAEVPALESYFGRRNKEQKKKSSKKSDGDRSSLSVARRMIAEDEAVHEEDEEREGRAVATETKTATPKRCCELETLRGFDKVRLWAAEHDVMAGVLKEYDEDDDGALLEIPTPPERPVDEIAVGFSTANKSKRRERSKSPPVREVSASSRRRGKSANRQTENERAWREEEERVTAAAELARRRRKEVDAAEEERRRQRQNERWKSQQKARPRRTVSPEVIVRRSESMARRQQLQQSSEYQRPVLRRERTSSQLFESRRYPSTADLQSVDGSPNAEWLVPRQHFADNRQPAPLQPFGLLAAAHRSDPRRRSLHELNNQDFTHHHQPDLMMIPSAAQQRNFSHSGKKAKKGKAMEGVPPWMGVNFGPQTLLPHHHPMGPQSLGPHPGFDPHSLGFPPTMPMQQHPATMQYQKKKGKVAKAAMTQRPPFMF